MSLATRLEALVAQKPGLSAAALARHVAEHMDATEAVEPVLARLVAEQRVEGRARAGQTVYHIAGAAAPSDEFRGRNGLDPTRFGDWENKGICVDF